MECCDLIIVPILCSNYTRFHALERVGSSRFLLGWVGAIPSNFGTCELLETTELFNVVAKIALTLPLFFVYQISRAEKYTGANIPGKIFSLSILCTLWDKKYSKLWICRRNGMSNFEVCHQDYLSNKIFDIFLFFIHLHTNFAKLVPKIYGGSGGIFISHDIVVEIPQIKMFLFQ